MSGLPGSSVMGSPHLNLVKASWSASLGCHFWAVVTLGSAFLSLAEALGPELALAELLGAASGSVVALMPLGPADGEAEGDGEAPASGARS